MDFPDWWTARHSANRSKWHFPPLICTFFHCSRKTNLINRAATKFFNEINDLAPNCKVTERENMFKNKYLEQAMQVIPEAQASR